MNILKKQLNFRNVSVLFLIVYFAVFLFYPIYKAFAGSLHDWNPLIQKYNYIGWENYRFVLGDKLFWKSLTNTLVLYLCLDRLAVGSGFGLGPHALLAHDQDADLLPRPLLYADCHPHGGRLLRLDVDV